MRKTTFFPVLFVLVVFFVPSMALSQEAQEDLEIAAAPDADASPGAIGLPATDALNAGSPCAETLPSPVRLADVQQGKLLLKTVHAGIYVPAPVLETDVAIHVAGLVARTTVSQRFCNPTQLWVEGVYAFPLPENAAVDTLTLLTGGRVIEGQIKERAEAQQIYEQAKAEGKRASLLEQQRPNLFTTSLANLGPGETAEIRIEYQQELRWENGRFSLRFPMVDTPRYMPGGAETPPLPDSPRTSNRINPVNLTVDLETGFPLARLASASHAVRSRETEYGRYEVELAGGAVPADRDFVLEWTPAAGAAPQGALLTQEIGGETYALLMVMPPKEAAGKPFDQPREIVYIIDTSGSMGGASIREAKAALDLALTRLEPSDSFNVIEFNSVTNALFPSSLPATPGNVDQAREWVAGLEATGGTEMLDALRAALGGPVASGGMLRQVIFMTDGAVGNEEELFAYIHTHLGDSRLFTVGIGSAPNSYFMTKAAEFGRGTFTYIGNLEEVESKLKALFAKLDRPALTDVEVAWSDPGAEIYPQRIPDLYLGQPIVAVAKLLSAFPGEVALSGSTSGAPWKVSVKVLSAAEHSGLDKLWARRKIDELGNALALGGDAAKIRPAIVELGLNHHLGVHQPGGGGHHAGGTEGHAAQDDAHSGQRAGRLGERLRGRHAAPGRHLGAARPGDRLPAPRRLSLLLPLWTAAARERSGGALVKRPLAMALVLFTASAVFLGRGAWIFAKAQVAQVLLARAWEETRAGGRAVKPWPWADTWPVARLTVPRLGVEEIVLAGGHGQAMAFGPGHLSRSAAPGSAGNVALAGHRDTHFRFLRNLRPGDEILLEAANGPARRYRVTETAVVDSHDRRPLVASLESTLTLITCYPFDAIVPGGPLRYVVRAGAAVGQK